MGLIRDVQISLLNHLGDGKHPQLEANFTAQGRLYYAGINCHQMTVDNYRKTWKPYEAMMEIAIESAIDEASKAIEMYKKNTYKELRT